MPPANAPLCRAKSGELPHLLFYGPSGAGKKTRVMALLREVFGPGVEKVKLEHRGFKTPTGRAVEVTTIASHFVRILKGGSGEFVPRLTRSPFQHVEINPGDAGIYDRYVVQEISMSLIGKRFCHSLDYAPPPSLPQSRNWRNTAQVRPPRQRQLPLVMPAVGRCCFFRK